MTRLSHSACSRYQMCPKSYQYHYLERIRPRVFSAALAFGSAFDDAANALLTGSGDPYKVFYATFKRQKINDVETDLPKNTNLVYAEADFDPELIEPLRWSVLETEYVVAKEALLARYASIKESKKKQGFESLNDHDKSFFNHLNWTSMLAKGCLMIDAYKAKVLPLIERVHCVQREVALDNGQGDKIVGFVDLIADIMGHGTVIIDHKTSTQDYEQDAVLTSPQLSLYMHALEEEFHTRKAGYVVFRKGVVKNRKKVCEQCGHDGSGSRAKTCDANVHIGGRPVRCGGTWHETIAPEIAVQILIDEIPALTEEIVVNNYDEINKAIKSGSFPRNFNSCHHTYGANCPYLHRCFSGSMKGLVKV